jgi:hypothetical protein
VLLAVALMPASLERSRSFAGRSICLRRFSNGATIE